VASLAAALTALVAAPRAKAQPQLPPAPKAVKKTRWIGHY
jgi:hypothetical protein